MKLYLYIKLLISFFLLVLIGLNLCFYLFKEADIHNNFISKIENINKNLSSNSNLQNDLKDLLNFYNNNIKAIKNERLFNAVTYFYIYMLIIFFTELLPKFLYLF